MSFDPTYSRDDRPGTFTPRGTFVPPWYVPHTDSELVVLSAKGEPLGFTIEEVAPERRWAVAPDGKCMERFEFNDLLRQWYEGQWTWQVPPVPPLDCSALAYPMAEAFVAKGVDPSNPHRLVTLTPPVARNYHPNAERPVTAEQLIKAGWRPAPAPEAPPPTATESGRPMVSAPCGKTLGGPQGMANHMRNCADCKALETATAPSEAGDAA